MKRCVGQLRGSDCGSGEEAGRAIAAMEKRRAERLQQWKRDGPSDCSSGEETGRAIAAVEKRRAERLQQRRRDGPSKCSSGEETGRAIAAAKKRRAEQMQQWRRDGTSDCSSGEETGRMHYFLWRHTWIVCGILKYKLRIFNLQDSRTPFPSVLRVLK